MEKLIVGKIVKAQGIKGEVKIRSYLDDGNLFRTFRYLYVGDIRTQVRCARYQNGFAYVGFTTIVDRNQAETLRNCDVFADREQIVLGEYSYFIDDMIGLNVILDNGVKIGRLDGVMPNKIAADICVVKGENGNILFPFLKDLIVEMNVEDKKMVLSAKRFAEVSTVEE